MDRATLLADCRHASAYALELEKLLAESDPLTPKDASQLQANLVVYSERLVALAGCVRVAALRRVKRLKSIRQAQASAQEMTPTYKIPIGDRREL